MSCILFFFFFFFSSRRRHTRCLSDWSSDVCSSDLSAGTACLADAAGFPLGPVDGPLPLWHSGQGGEIARGYYGPVRSMGRRSPRGELVERLYAAFTARRPGREAPLNPTGARLVRAPLP